MINVEAPAPISAHSRTRPRPAAEEEDRHGRPDEVELLLDRQRPQVLQQRRSAGRSK